MLCVVLGHVVDGYIKSNMFPAQNHQMTVIYNGIYSFHMALFFVISGMLFSHSYLTGTVDKSRMKTKILNFVGTYLIFSIVMGMFKMLFSGYVNNQVSVWDLLLIPVKAIYLYWYLYVLIVFYIFFSVVNTEFLLNKHNVFMVVGLLLSVIAIQFNVTNWFELRFICYYFVFFCIGIFIEKQVFKENRNIIKLVAVGGMFLLVCLSYRLGLYSVYKVLVALTISGMFLYIFKNVSLLSKIRPLLSCGKHCMEIYVFHCFFTAGLRPVFKVLGLTSSCIVSVILNMILSVLGSIIIALICKKIHIYDLLFTPYSFLKRKLVNSKRMKETA
jgi:fucose 4-O-acetylase-like acetyltransferase